MSSKKWDDVNNIYKFRNTLLEYLDYRDFDISDYKNFSHEELVEMCKYEQLDFIVEKKTILINFFSLPNFIKFI